MSARDPLLLTGRAAGRATATRQAILGGIATVVAALGAFVGVSTWLHPFLGVVSVAAVLAVGLTLSMFLYAEGGAE